MTKKIFWFGLLLFVSSVKVLSAEAANLPFKRGDGKINFWMYHLGEGGAVVYRHGGDYDRAGIKKIEHLFRSREHNETHPVDLKLIELLDHLEDHFQVRKIELISGFRSTAFNAELKNTGHNVANESYHTKGMASDVHLDEISETALRDYAQKLKVGGVGYYPALNMVHVDVGPVRTWAEQAPIKDWVGEKSHQLPLDIRVSPAVSIGAKTPKLLEIKSGESVAIDSSRMIVELASENGIWKTIDQLVLKGAQKVLPGHSLKLDLTQFKFATYPKGKYRLKIYEEGSGHFEYSNEFYLKRF